MLLEHISLNAQIETEYICNVLKGEIVISGNLYF